MLILLNEAKTLNPKISIIIPVYNGSNYVSDAIESAINQTYTNIEIIVINDGSDDNGATENAILKYKDKIKYFHKENGGVSTALNLGIEKMTGEYVSWLSHDDVYTLDKIEKQVNILKTLEKETIVFSDYTVVDSSLNKLYFVDLSCGHYIKELNNLMYDVINGTLNGCTMLIPKSFFIKCGNFEITQRNTQDYDMWFRMAKEDLPIYYLHDNVLLSRVHSDQGSASAEHRKLCDLFWLNVFENITLDEYNKNFSGLYNCLYNVKQHFLENGYIQTNMYIAMKLNESKLSYISKFCVKINYIFKKIRQKLKNMKVRINNV